MRLGVWTQGCELACPGCMSRHTWDRAGGVRTPVVDLLARWQEALDRGASGLTVSGGEPCDQPAALGAFLRGADELRSATGVRAAPDGGAPDLLVYTGYEDDELTAEQRAALATADAVVTGRFKVAEPTDLVWRGSANQRLCPRTELGRLRYGPHLTRVRRPHDAGLQVVVDRRAEDGTWPMRWYGIPRRGDLTAWEREGARRGLSVSAPSWRA
ncbi:4Fe-4S single cluster domain-containing protein [Streptomyces panaciradicis]|uniref:4Fe-4S single cluster domain-containing protein n=1 Tax=Streptomyces panaciradicis TaxID=1470261 RepID=UPI0024C20191|nr:4Fe-4S single cluster domain-containing protein [Streptomyces panaciradicis]